MMTGYAMAVLVETVVLPFESIEVMGTGIAMGVLGKAFADAADGVMTKVLDAGSSIGGVREAGASFNVGPSSSSVEVDVVVRYNAVSNMFGP